MEPIWIGVIGLAIMILLLFSSMHIATCLGLTGFVGFAVLSGGFPVALSMSASTLYTAGTKYEMAVLPLFILMGAFALHSGLGENMFVAARHWFGRFRGSLALITTVANGMFGVISGSTLAAVALFGKLALPEMLKSGYDKRFATGAIAASGTFAIMIPPSMAFVIYGLLTEESIGQLFMAGIIPGVITVLFYLVTIWAWCKIEPNIAPASLERFTWKERAKSALGLWEVALIAFVILGGIYSGILTIVETAAVGALVTVLIPLVRGHLKGKAVLKAFWESSRLAAMIFAIVVCALIFSRFMAVSQLPTKSMGFITGLGLSPIVTVIAFIIVLVILGCFLDAIGIMAITLPIMYPVVVSLGFSPIWFGVLVVKANEIGQVTPPFGMNVFALKAVAGDSVEMGDIFAGAIRFLIPEFVVLALLIAFPALSLWTVPGQGG